MRIGFPLSRKFSSDGCPGIGEAEASASVGMILEAANDPYLNCIEESAVAPVAEAKEDKPEEKEEAGGQPGTEQQPQGKLFTDDEFEKVVKTKIVKTPGRSRGQKAPKVQKPAKEGPSGLQVLWKKVGTIFENGFDGVLGGLYDEMGNNNEGKE